MSLFTFTVNPQETFLEYRDGKLNRILEAGRHRRVTRARLVRVNRREQLVTLAPQEVLTADGVTVRVTAAMLWSVAEPQVFHEASTDPLGMIYLATQIGLREALSQIDVDTVVTDARRTLTSTITSVAAAAGESIGIAVREVLVKDVILPGDLRSAYAELVTARQRGKAQLETARAETAALRSLANAAKLLDDSPALAQLRMIQSLPHGSQLKVTLD